MPAQRWLIAELVALAGLVALTWILGRVACDAWLGRVAALGVQAPAVHFVRDAATRADAMFSAGVVVLAVARTISLRRRGDPLIVPWLLPAALGAALFGLVIHHATVEVAGGVALAPTAAGFAQGVLIGCVAGAAILVVPIDLVELAIRARIGIAVAIALVFAALAIAGSGPAGSGTRINLGPIQPIELVKPLAILFLAAYLGARASKLRWQRERFLGLRWPRPALLLPALLALLGIVGGLYVIGDLGPVLLLAFVFLGMFYLVSRATGWAVIALALVVLVLAVLGLAPELAGGGTVQTRLRMWTDPWTNALSNGHQLGEGLWATAAGGVTGQGLAHAATPIVPAGKTDLVLATLTEQLGAVGLVTYQLLLVALVAGCLRVAAYSRTAERVLIAGGVAILVLVQWAVIQAGTFGQLPLTGIVAPFLSGGRTSMVVFVASVALVARLAADGRAREHTIELAELQGGVRGVSIVAAMVAIASIVAGLFAAVVGRHATSARGIVTRLADGTLIERQNPRLLALVASLRRGAITDRHGAPLATAGRTRSYPLGTAMGTLLGVHPARVLLPPWSLERALDHRLRGYPERAHRRGLAAPDLTRFAPLLDLSRADRGAGSRRSTPTSRPARSRCRSMRGCRPPPRSCSPRPAASTSRPRPSSSTSTPGTCSRASRSPTTTPAIRPGRSARSPANPRSVARMARGRTSPVSTACSSPARSASCSPRSPPFAPGARQIATRASTATRRVHCSPAHAGPGRSTITRRISRTARST